MVDGMNPGTEERGTDVYDVVYECLVAAYVEYAESVSSLYVDQVGSGQTRP